MHKNPCRFKKVKAPLRHFKTAIHSTIALVLSITYIDLAGAHDPGPDNVIKISITGFSQSMRTYHEEVFKEALATTVKHYGPYEIIIVDHNWSANRGKQEMSQNSVVHLAVTATKRELSNITLLQYPLYDGVQGLRHLIVDKYDADRFSEISSANIVFDFRIGHGPQWYDTTILRHNRLKVIEAEAFENLFPMLLAKRFDYISLGITEADETLTQLGEMQKQLTVLPNLYIFYPIPFYIEVSQHNPKIEERALIGLKNLQKSGKLRKLFNRSFGKKMHAIHESTANVLVLENPGIPPDKNADITKKVLQRYFSKSRKFYSKTNIKVNKISSE